MRRGTAILLVVATLGVASPALARGPGGNGGAPAESPALQNLLRLEVGLGIGSEGWGCHAGLDLNPYYACNAWTYGGYLPFVLGVGMDLQLDGRSFLSPGVNVLLGTLSFSNAGFSNANQRLTTWEGYLDYVFKFGEPDQWTRGRVRAGVAGYLGGGLGGGGLRIGGGASFFQPSRVGVGLDLILEGGVFGGYWVSTLQILVSPEIHLW